MAAKQAAGDQAVRDLSIISDHYSAFQPGIKKVAVNALNRAFKKTMKGWMERWKDHVEECRNGDFDKLMNGANQKVFDLENLVLSKRDSNRMLEEENRNIRDVCFEGTKTAKVFMRYLSYLFLPM